MEPQYKLEEDGYFIEKDATFSIEEFMADLERFYQAMRMQFAFEQMCLGNDEPALALHEDGKHFSGLPFFEQYHYAPENFSKIDYSSARGNLLKEMQLDAENQEAGFYGGCPFGFRHLLVHPGQKTFRGRCPGR